MVNSGLHIDSDSSQSSHPSGTHFLQRLVAEASWIRIVLLFVLTVYAHLVSVLQKPFLEPGFLYLLYSMTILIFTYEFISFFKKKRDSTIHHIIEIGFIFFVFQLIPSQSSVILFVLLSYLFIVGVANNFKFVIQLALMASILYSFVNAIELQLNGAQNILSLILFNSSFFVVAFISGVVSTDLTLLKGDLIRSEKNLASQTALASTLMQHMPAQVYALNNKGRIVFTNQAEVDDAEKFLSELLQRSRSAHGEFIRLFDIHSREDRFWQLEQAYYFDQALESEIRLILVRDQTERNFMQQTLRQNEKLAAIGQLAAGIAHEIRNPLAGISGSVELLSKESTNSDDKKLMNIIMKEINRLNNLITEFLDYAKPDKKPEHAVDISNIVSEVSENIRRSLPNERYQIQVELTHRANILGDADKLKQALLNIAMNAVQAMNQTDAPLLNIQVKVEGSKVRVKVQDNGSGMSEEVKNRIFEPFFTTKAKGTGLGLAMTHKILQVHDCEVQIKSAVGQGTTFTLEFKSLIA